MAVKAILVLCASALLVKTISGQYIGNAGVVDINDVNVVGNGATGWIGNGIVDSYNAGYGFAGNSLAAGYGLAGNSLAAGYGLAGNSLAAGYGLAGSGLATGLVGNGLTAGIGLAGSGLAAGVVGSGLSAGIGLAGSGVAGYNAGYGLAGAGINYLSLNNIAANNYGGAFTVTSASPIAPTGISVWSENAIEGPLAVAGQLPVLSAVAFDAQLPTAGAAGASYGCGNGNIGIVSEGLTVAAAPLATGFAAAPLATGFAAAPLATGFAAAPIATGFAASPVATEYFGASRATGFAASPIAAGFARY